MDWKDKLGQANKLFEEAKTILTNPESTTEDRAKVGKMLADAQQYKADALQLQSIMKAAKELDAVSSKEKKEQERDQQRQMTAEKPFESLGEMLHSIKAWAVGAYKDPRLQWFSDSESKPVEMKDMVENVGASGGFLVPPEYIANLYAVMAENSIVRSRATIIPMRRRQVDIPVLDQTGTTASVPHWFGGMTFYWAEEAAEKTESDPSFRKISLVGHKLIGYTRASDELVDDSAISLSAFLTGPMGFAGGAAWPEEYAFLNGTGAGQPLGVINAGATITVARAAGGPTIGYADLINMYENFLPTGQGLWIISQSAISNLMTIADAAGNYIWQPNAQQGHPQMLLGFPVVFSEKVPRIGTAGDVVLADWKYYLIGDRQAVTIESTQFDRWRYDETSWRMVHRVDGQPWLSTYLTYQDGTSTVSPFVILGDKST